MLNKCELHYNVDFDPLALKMRIDEGFPAAPDPQRWVPRVMEDNLRIWTADEGMWPNNDPGMLQVEYYLPEVDDPAILYYANYPHHRLIYDMEHSNIIEHKKDWSSKQIDIMYNLTNRTIVSSREFVTKRIHFETRQILENKSE